MYCFLEQGFNVLFLVTVPVDTYDDFINLKDLPAQSLKMLVRVGFGCAHP